MKKADIGIYGLGVMGRNLALNFNDHDFGVSAYNPNLPGEEDLAAAFASDEAAGTPIRTFDEVDSFVASLERPRKILLMVKAGRPVDTVIDQLIPLLDKKDILIDGGNTHYSDTNRRLEMLSQRDIRYIGMGVSGGEEGARHGPSLMPGGDAEAWPVVQPFLESIAALSPDGGSCCAWMGPESGGHFVKMVHNGIEYAIMQLIAECYQLMRDGLHMENQAIADTFDSWDSGLLNSYLLEITTRIFNAEEENGNLILDHILDRAGQKGTGRWTALAALELGIPLPLITESVFARSISSFKDLRRQASEAFRSATDEKREAIDTTRLRQALLGGQLVAFAEGFWLLKAANEEFGWNIPFGKVAHTWSGGCIIRSALLQPIATSYRENPGLPHLLLAPAFRKILDTAQEGWRSAARFGVETGIPVPATAAALSHYDSLRTKRLPANLIQAQRDYFGAHQYERLDRPGGTFFHTDWQEKGRE
ncbi:6-phosphogluconate dehydrogenase (decarboxylating) [Fodinibius roseus]|uniref:6-phosphogluconate dehydrogenase, decarboxylating n=1 Tax=Fodinibius roseus TaxID=1194090 RepID=A0A1M5FLT8_9BACT|nr:decarboxylating NADP(+)-dependent phosphogluconate dehydrogenase [Fodinibius roseus]SHF92463.1 6-phosphogluconate dehydrogenase (decarboxylating) [Fodinibius roseus]